MESLEDLSILAAAPAIPLCTISITHVWFSDTAPTMSRSAVKTIARAFDRASMRRVALQFDLLGGTDDVSFRRLDLSGPISAGLLVRLSSSAFRRYTEGEDSVDLVRDEYRLTSSGADVRMRVEYSADDKPGVYPSVCFLRVGV